jgi:predicted methyltransferase
MVCASLFVTGVAVVPVAGLAAPPLAIAAAVESSDRPEADRARDATRKPAELSAFAGLKPDSRVADFIPGPVYFTRIFSKIVGDKGRVYAYTPGDLLKRAPKAADEARALAAEPGYANVMDIEMPFSEMAFPEALDLFWVSQIYHDIRGIWGADAAAGFNAAVFSAVKPGGIYLVTDHVAARGTSEADMERLHRIDPALVMAQVTAAGFVVDGETEVLANPADAHDKPVFDPSIRGRTDQFVIRFRKPAR